jgi:hypothetical protein
MNQPRLSKLMRKLLRVRWIQVKRSKTDRRIRLMTTTVTAQAWMTSLKQDLETLLRAEGLEQAPAPSRRTKPSAALRRQGITPQQGQTGFDLGE